MGSSPWQTLAMMVTVMGQRELSYSFPKHRTWTKSCLNWFLSICGHLSLLIGCEQAWWCFYVSPWLKPQQRHTDTAHYSTECIKAKVSSAPKAMHWDNETLVISFILQGHTQTHRHTEHVCTCAYENGTRQKLAYILILGCIMVPILLHILSPKLVL